MLGDPDRPRTKVDQKLIVLYPLLAISPTVLISFFIKYLPFYIPSLPWSQSEAIETVDMGQTLSEPVTCKATTSQQNEFLYVGTSSMQGFVFPFVFSLDFSECSLSIL